MFSSGPKSDPLIENPQLARPLRRPAIGKEPAKAFCAKFMTIEVKALAKPFEKQFGVSLQAALKTQPAQSGRRTGGRPRANRELTDRSTALFESFEATSSLAVLPMEQQLPVRKVSE
jgi:hypothetical protein